MIMLMIMHFHIFSKTMPDLVRLLENEINVALTWLDRNEMVANPDKFHALLARKDREVLMDKI